MISKLLMIVVVLSLMLKVGVEAANSQVGVKDDGNATPQPTVVISSKDLEIYNSKSKFLESSIRELTQRSSAQNDLIRELVTKQDALFKKLDDKASADVWQSVLVALLAAGIPAGVAIWIANKITKAQNKRQNALQEIQVVEKFLPYFEKGGDSIRAALIALWGIDRKDLVLHLVNVFASLESASALQDLVTKEPGEVQKLTGQVLAQTFETLARILFVNADYIAAEYLYRQALKIRVERNETKTIEYATDLREMSLSLSRRGYYKDSELGIREACVIGAELAKGHRLAQFKNDLGTVCESLGKYDESEKSLREAIDLYGDDWDHQPEKEQTRTNLAVVLDRQGRFDEALSVYKAAIDFYDQRYGPINDLSAICQGNLGLLLFKLGRNAEAEKFLRNSLFVKTKHFGPDRQEVISGLTNLSDCLIHQRQFEEGEKLALQAKELVTKFFGEESLRMATVLALFAKMERLQGNTKHAIETELRALEITERAVGSNHVYVEGRLLSLSSLYMNQGDFGKARGLLDRALSISIPAYGESSPHVDMARIYLAECLIEMNSDLPRAKELLDVSLTSVEATLGKEHPSYAQVLARFGALLLKQSKPKEAEEYFIKVLQIQNDNKTPKDVSMANTMHNLATALWDRSEHDEALIWNSSALNAMELSLGGEHPELLNILRARVLMLKGLNRLSECQQVQNRIDIISKKYP